ncbi:hypothetical protein BDZ85DRAFT_108535 [Elsinoe ampelina]|uniref:Uncharacterized protein n=1 Tax=Elsinoe ampelina TaxID=302913 RepID=A0A6A6GCF0_9PEZI|nr:hypothetical protein BDZ85DRAFT_108535 [Elsinoe ampelina]
MAADLCCADPRRIDSPDLQPARQASLDPRKRSQSLPRNKRLSREDRMELNRIFVGASLPEDHPHAIPLSNRRPILFTKIIRSPSFSRKLKRQLSRTSLITSKSLVSLRSHPVKLLHRRSRMKSKAYLVENVMDKNAVSPNEYDSDARSVRINSTRFNTDARQRVVTPVNENARQNITGFE